MEHGLAAGGYHCRPRMPDHKPNPAVRAFAGEDYTRAVIAPDARPLLTRYDERSVHYETAFSVD